MSDVNPSIQFDFEEEAHDAPMDSNPTVDVRMADTEQDKELRDDIGLVDMHAFNQLQARFDTLANNHATLNENVTKLTELVKNWMTSFPQTRLLGDAPLPGASASPKTPPSLSIGLDNPLEVNTKETMELLKNMKPPVFKGEEKERNKDAVDTFLSKWAEIHDMRNTHDKVKPLHTSLSLEGKAYKWWMAYKPNEKPKTWAEFEIDFRKEFLPSNERQRNWKAWDLCKQKHRSLTQYVSLYRDIILKLDGLEEFQQVRGFLRGLNPDIQKNVQSKDPQTLDEAIKQAHVFADPSDDHEHEKTKHKFNRTHNTTYTKFSSNKKRKNNNDISDQAKKNKTSQKVLSKEDFEHAKKENLCFVCMGNHPKRDCPTLKKAGPNKDK